MIDAALLAKFRRRAPRIVTQDHLDKAMFLFPPEHHDEIATQIQPLLQPKLIARNVDALPELKIANPDAPLVQEATVQRLNNMAAVIQQMQADQKPMRDHIEELKAQVETQKGTISALIAQRDGLENELTDRDGQIEKLKVQTRKA